MPPPVYGHPRAVVPASDPLEGTLGAIVSRQARGHPPSQGRVHTQPMVDAIMQGTPVDFGTATQDFSKAIMQYMRTEYEAMLGAPTALGDERP